MCVCAATAGFYYARGAEHRPNTEFMNKGPLSPSFLTFLPSIHRPPLMEHERPTWKLSDALVCADGDCEKYACVSLYGISYKTGLVGLIEFQMDHYKPKRTRVNEVVTA